MLNGVSDTICDGYLCSREPNDGHPRETIMKIHSEEETEANLGRNYHYCTGLGCLKCFLPH